MHQSYIRPGSAAAAVPAIAATAGEYSSDEMLVERIAAGDTKSEIKDKLVAQFGESVLAAPPARGFNLLAWLVPIAGGLAAVVAVAFLALRWSRSRAAPAAGPSVDGRRPLDPELERRVDVELARFEG